MYAKVILSLKNKEVDKVFDYFVPQQYCPLCVGVRVIVPFGKGNKSTEGYVVDVAEQTEVPSQKLKSIIKVLDEGKPIFTKESILLAQWMQKKYFCTLSQCLQTMMPAGIKTKFQWQIVLKKEAEEGIFISSIEKNLIDFLKQKQGTASIEEVEEELGKNTQNAIQYLKEKEIIALKQNIKQKSYEKQVILYTLSDDDIAIKETWEKAQIKANMLAQKRIMEYLADGKEVTANHLKQELFLTDSPIKTLLKKGVLKQIKRVEKRQVTKSNVLPTGAFVPTQEQKQALTVLTDLLEQKQKKPVLLHGITGSGKTEIYMQMIEKVIQKGQQAIVLVPEISLTPLMVERFLSRFGEKVSVTHSRLNYGERYDQWKKAKEKEISIIIGPRSALFMPFDNLGMIIIDEEHESSYRSDTTPKYDAREVAMQMSRMTGCLLLMGSATPDLVTYHKAITGEYMLLTLKNRTKGSHLPHVTVTDMRQELEEGNRSVFSRQLLEAMKQNIQNKRQTILFLNRRGYATFVSCRQCGHVMKCNQCDIAYTYHYSEQELVCHYCGERIQNPSVCPVCGSKYIKYFGTGTQKIEQEIKKIFPEATVLRMDLDTTTSKNSHQKILEQFGKGKADILIGTQMIAKGHDFPNVTLVGILAADLSLHMASYRASEISFQLITQAAGRAGRDELSGEVFIQTYSPEHYSILLAARQDYEAFYEQEIQIRKMMNYPPYCNIFTVVFSGKNEKEVIESARYLTDIMLYYNRKKQFEILGPTPAILSKFRQEYRWRLLIKCTEEELLRQFVIYCCEKWYSHKKWDVLLNLTMNPVNVV